LVIKTITVWLTEIIVKWNDLRREYKILHLSLAELSGRNRLASQHALAETFVFPRRQTVKLFAAPSAAATLNPRNNSLSN
jgi:hypothetical protein